MSVTVVPRRLTRVARAVAVLTLVAFAILAWVLPQGASGDQQFGVGDQIAFFGFGVLLAVGVLAFTRFRVVGDEEGLRVRNVLGERFFPWAIIVSVDLPAGAPWAHLDLQDDERVALMAVQANDKDAAVDAVLALRSLQPGAAPPA
jgi:hypothetical protein